MPAFVTAAWLPSNGIFFKTYSMPPGRWLLEKRLAAAKHLLLSPEKSVHDVAFESGFKNNAHFSRSYQKFLWQFTTAIQERATHPGLRLEFELYRKFLSRRENRIFFLNSKFGKVI
jgi:hypothetical protein